MKNITPTPKSSPAIRFILLGLCVLLYLATNNPNDLLDQHLAYDLQFIPERDYHLSLSFFIHAISYQFMHANFLHLLFNMLALLVFSTPIEAAFGRWKFLSLYLLGGIFAVWAQNFFAYSEVPIVGASGSIASVMAAYLLLYGRTQIWVLLIFIPVRMPAALLMLIWLLFNLFELATGNQTIAIWAHFGGFLFGLVATLFVKPANIAFLQKLR